MLLVISNPFESDNGLSPTESHLYLTTKYQFSLFLSLSCPSIEMVQAGILIALYEYAQGATDMSYVTIGSCATLAYLLGLHQASHTPSIMTGENQRVDEERNCTWWAIVALDRSSSSTISRLLCVQSIANPYTFRYINMESLSTLRPPAVENPAPEKNLPQQYQPWDDTLHTTDSLPLSDCGSGSVWYYRCEANAARILGQVQDLIRENHSDNTMRLEKASRIYNDLEGYLIQTQKQHGNSLCNRLTGGFVTSIGSVNFLFYSQ
jgi:hypothetical protein